MNNVVDKYYKGYEGEPEIQIIKKSTNNERIVLRIWIGFFDDIMTAIEPNQLGGHHWLIIIIYIQVGMKKVHGKYQILMKQKNNWKMSIEVSLMQWIKRFWKKC